LEELEALSPTQRGKHLAQLQGRLTDTEQEEDDLDETQRDLLVDETTSALELDQLRTEIAALNEVLARAKRLKDKGPEADSKLAALQECLKKAEFHELKDGRGKLLIFTEHRDTLKHLREHLDNWGYSTCEIHGGMNPHERKRAQEDFRVSRQVCVATEAAGEGINLQFCHLMVNYDLPWNPTRLEQRLGRIHRIGQTLECHAFNFVAAESEEGQPIIEGRILQRLLEKLEQMRAVLADRVFDVIGEVLSLNDVNLPEMLREAAHDPRRLDEYLDIIEKVDPSRLMSYEKATGIALARANVDFSGIRKANVEAEERRLMPAYVEDQFVKASKEIGLKVEPRADGLWRVEHVLADLRSERLETVRRIGKPKPSYPKITFRKSDFDKLEHGNAELLGPGHPLYSAVDEKLNKRLASLAGATAVYIDSIAESPYLLHFFEISIRGQNTKGVSQALYGELVAVREETVGNTPEKFSIIPADVLLDLPVHPSPPVTVHRFDSTLASDFLKSTYQSERRETCQKERQHFVGVCRDYLEQSFTARIHAAQNRVMSLRAREGRDSDLPTVANSPESAGAKAGFALARQRVENDLADLQRTRQERMEGLKRLEVARHGPLRHLATAVVLPATQAEIPAAADLLDNLDPDTIRRSELAAEDVVIAHETGRGWETEKVGHLKIGFDIRSLGPADAQTGYRDPVAGVRRIEVKGRMAGQPIRLTTNEWYKAQQLGDSFWLYVVWNPLNNPNSVPVMIQNPAKHLEHAAKPVVSARFYDISAESIQKAALRILQTEGD
ncbi:MAG: DUF3883 domain-containing protein, partial [Kiritimatiellae bacterium]|nr:DUF3883 domain-containing protein [Kiritimatiellia bacterium]